MFRHSIPLFTLSILLSFPSLAQEQNGNNQDKALDVRSSAGDLHVGADADARKAGLPLYPGARIKSDSENEGKLNLGLLTDAFGIQLVVAKYESDDAPTLVIDYYRDKLKKYGKVLECHSRKEHFGANVDSDDDDSSKQSGSKQSDSKQSKELKCEGDNSGPVTELKVGTEENQHVVAIEPRDSGKGATFALVYVHTRGKRGEI